MGDLAQQNNNAVPAPSYASVTDGYQSALKVVDDVILKNYISELTKMEVVPLDQSVIESNMDKNVCFFKITEMVYEKDEFAPYKFASVFNILSMAESSIFIIIDSDGVKTDFYMGVRSPEGSPYPAGKMSNIVEDAMKAYFPGMKTPEKQYDIDEMKKIVSGIKEKNISAVSCVANNREQNNATNQTFVQGLEKLVLSMQHEKYTGIIIANGTTQTQLKELRRGYETVYTQLSALATTQVNYTSNNSFNYAVAETKGNSTAKSEQKNWSESHNHSEQSGSSTQHGISKESVAGKTIKGVASAASILGAALAPVTGGASLVVGGVVSGGLGLLGSAISSNVSDSTTTNQSVTDGFSTVQGGSSGITESVNYGITKTEGLTRGISEGMTLTLHDKSIEDTLARIDRQLKRIDEFESLGMYECAAYFLSDDSSAEIAASTYKALMRGENSGVEIAAINSWGQGKETDTKLIAQYVKNFIHPVFQYDGVAGNIEVTPCSLVSGNELSIHMGLPRKSVCGLPVIEHADFGSEVVTYDNSKRPFGINLGKIFNMGSLSENNVQLSINSLSMHTFITGSTGSGKSNTVYEMIRQLDNFGISYLIIEPAKGEYKNVFGSMPGVHVYGTNQQYADLLRINPFKFAKGIHILEHIDRIIEIFNVCWPMYAAMPAVLKNAIEQSYIDCGWNLVRSTNKYGKDLYPSFADVAKNIKTIIDTSEYDNENKGAYKGSLLTRLQSLTNGIYGMIFTCDDLDDTELFDKKVIVDLSRVGSSETKSLIMGMLVLKLQEHRMANATGMNEKLKHITVLEEAHNLLKRTSTEQSSDSGNLRGKSVEMLTNAIAEMRTYGEGFVITDQAPGLLDMAVIRNTNTKIIMRLPDHSDRELVGRSANLNDDQIEEIAKLPCGVAAVYQNDWVQPVLCKVSKYDRPIKLYKYTPSEDAYLDDAENAASDSLLDCIMGKEIFGAGNRTEIRHLCNKVLRSRLDSSVKKEFIEYISAADNEAIASLRHLIYNFLSAEKAIADAAQCNNINDWVHVVVDGLNPSIKEYSKKQIDLVLALILYEKSLQDSEYNDIFCRFTELYKSEGGVF